MNYFLDKIHIKLYSSLRTYCCNLDSSTILKMEEEGYFVKEEYHSNKMQGYYYNYLIKKRDDNEGAIFIGFRLNSYREQADGLRFVGVEYNPQKIQIPKSLQQFFCNNGYKYSSVKNCDVAMDFLNLTLTDFRVNTQKNMMFVGSSSNLTRYISPSSNHLRIKIYDKSKERKRLGFDIPQTIRVEITLKKPQFFEHYFMTLEDEEYIKDVRRSVGEISIPACVPLRINNLIEKYGAYNDALLFLLAKADETTLFDAYSLMSKQAASKYRAYFKEGQYSSIDIDVQRFHEQVSMQIRQSIVDTTALYNFVS